jgi:hypothetical protein
MGAHGAALRRPPLLRGETLRERVRQIDSAALVSRTSSLKTYCLGLRFVAVVVVADAAGI